MAKAEVNGTVIAESDSIQKIEGNIYFPKGDIKSEFLKDSPTRYTCPWKGDAIYHSLDINGEDLKDAAWTYPEPKDAAKEIKDHFAFDKSLVNVTE